MGEAGLEPVAYVGTPMGAVVGAALSAGRTGADLLEDVATLRRSDIAALHPLALLAGLRARSLFRAGPLRKTLERLVPARSFADCRVPVTVSAVDLESRELVWFGAGGRDVPVIDALYATSALPLYYPPAMIGGRRLADGGLRAVLPLEFAAGLGADVVVAVDIGPGFDEPPAGAGAGAGGPGMIRAYNEAIAIMMASQSAASVRQWRATPGAAPLVYIRPRVERGATFRIDRAEAYAGEGYRAAAEALETVRLGSTT